MYFTQEDYKKIETWLYRNSVKDSEFQEALPFTGKETVTIVQDGHNRKVNVKEFIEQLFNIDAEDFININRAYDVQNITLREAIALVPDKARKEGQVITFINEKWEWAVFQFVGKLNQWNNISLWKNPCSSHNYSFNSVGTIEDRPSLTPTDVGFQYFDITLATPIWWSGNEWIDSTGATI